MHRLAVAVALSLSPHAARAAARPEVAARSRVDAVTVHLSSARVSRLARVELPPGDAGVVLDGLPAELLDDSLRVEGQGAARTRIFGVSVEQVTESRAAAAEARGAEERLERLQEEDRALEDRVRVAQGRQKFVESLRSSYAEERAKNLAVRAVSSREWTDLAGWVEGQLTGAAAEIRRAELGRRDLGRRLTAAQAELARLQAKRSLTTKRVVVEVAAERAGPVELLLSYTVPSASWSPAWDARLFPDRAAVELDLLAGIENRTGEDWIDVKLSVSTAQPSRRLLVPELAPRWLSRLLPSPARTDGMLRKAVAAPAAAPVAAAAELAGAGDAVLEERAVVALARAEEGLLAATFTAPRRESVEGAGRARRIALSRYTLPAEIARVAAPRVDPAAFLTARMTNGTGVPLLGGSAGVYLGDEFVGRAPLAFTPPGGELTLAFGADARVEVERRVLERRHESAGIVSRDDVWRYRTRIAVKNRWAAPVTVRLLDLVPVSREQEIEVQLLDGTTAAEADPDRPGVRVHTLALSPREERTVEIRYQVRFPRGTPVSGLE